MAQSCHRSIDGLHMADGAQKQSVLEANGKEVRALASCRRHMNVN